jgi:predicted RNase H-like HicB family nuclease
MRAAVRTDKASSSLANVTTRRFGVLLEWDQAAQLWVTFVPSLDSLSTYGATREEALEQTRQAIVGYLEAAKKEGLNVTEAAIEPEVVELDRHPLSSLPSVSGRRLLRALQQAGFELVHVRGSHHYLRRPMARASSSCPCMETATFRSGRSARSCAKLS